MQRYWYPFTLAIIGVLLYTATPRIGQGIFAADFLNYWLAPHLAIQDVSVLFDLERYNTTLAEAYGGSLGNKLAWSYPPHLLLLFFPFGLMPHLLSMAIWTVVWFAFYAFFATRSATNAPLILSVFFLAISPTSILNIGQIGFFVSGLFLGAVYLLERKPVASGILLGFLTVKPQFGLLWPFVLLARKQWRTIIVAVLTVGILICFSLAIYGVAVWEGFINFTLPLQWFFTNEPYVPRVYQVLMYSLPNSLRILQVDPHIALTVHWVVTIPIASATVWAIRRDCSIETRALLLTTSALLCTPYTLIGDLTALTPVLLWRMLASTPRSLLQNILYGLGYLLPLLVPYFNLLYIPVSPAILLSLFLLALYEAKQTPSPLPLNS